MKSYFFGLNAKVALALLAISGTVLTGCYEKEDGDTARPYNPLPAAYVITVQVVNEQAEAITGATVTATGLIFTEETNGQYVAETDKAGSYTITAAHPSYDNSGDKTVIVTAVSAGEVGTHFAYIVLTNEAPDPVYPFEYSFTQVAENISTIFSADDDDFKEQVDWVNNGLAAKDIYFTITYDEGITYDQSIIPAGDFGDEVKAFLLSQFPAATRDKVLPTTDFDYIIRLAPLSSLESVTVNTGYVVYSYHFAQDTNSCDIDVYYAFSAEFSNIQRDWGHGSGHAHGNSHGHGGGLNAGGGIFEGI